MGFFSDFFDGAVRGGGDLWDSLTDTDDHSGSQARDTLRREELYRDHNKGDNQQ